MVPKLGRAAKKFAGLKASDAISKGKSRCEASDRLGRDLGTQGCLVIHTKTRSTEMALG